LKDNFLELIDMYKKVFLSCASTFFHILKSAHFVFFSVVCLAIGTMGIWIPVVFQLDVSAPASKISSNITYDNIAIFMYVVSVLGTVAAEYFIKNEDLKDPDSKSIHSFAMFIWFLAILLAFWALKEPRGTTWHLWVSLLLTISIWMSFTIKKEEFNFDQDEVSGKLSGVRSDSSVIQGKGI